MFARSTRALSLTASGFAALGLIGSMSPAPSAESAAPVRTQVELTAFLGLFGDGTAADPNAGLLIGNGYSYSSVPGDCPGTKACNGGNSGLLFGQRRQRL